MENLATFGLAAFIAVYAYIRSDNPININDLPFAISVSLLFWIAFNILGVRTAISFRKSLYASVLPSVIIINNADRNAYTAAQKPTRNLGRSIINQSISAFFAIVLNIIAAIAYAILFGA